MGLYLSPHHRYPQQRSNRPGLSRFQSFPWLGDRGTVFGAVLAVVVWQSVGFYMVLFVAAMQAIPPDYFEAARVDGANPWHMFWGLTVPLIWDTIRTAIVFLAIGAMDLFAIVTVMTNGTGGPSRAADVVPVYLYSKAFSEGQFGYATAMGLVLLIMVLAVSRSLACASPRANRLNTNQEEPMATSATLRR